MGTSGSAVGVARQRIEAMAAEGGIDAVRVGGVDIDGLWRGKRVGLSEFLDKAEGDGFHMANAVLGVSVADELIGGLAYTNPDLGFPDVHLVPDLDTFAPVAWAEGTASVLCDFFEADGSPTSVSPRHVLRTVLARCHERGLVPRIGYELEFYLFAETPESALAKGFGGLTPMFPALRTYSLAQLARVEGIIGAIDRQMGASGIPVEAATTEYSPSQFEINLRATDALSAADQVVRYKEGVREIAQAHGAVATFMAKYDAALGGSSAHVHQSLWDGDGNNVFAPGAGDGGGPLSLTGRRWLAGLLAVMGDLAALWCPTVNSYKRLASWSFAPTTVTWGVDNRTTAVRALGGSPSATRVEHRLPGADANPYLVIAACLAAGLHGVDHELDPPPAVTGNAYDLGPDDAVRLPGTLEEAITRLDESKVARELLGESFVEHFLTTRRHELATSRAAVTDWERRRYFEVI